MIACRGPDRHRPKRGIPVAGSDRYREQDLHCADFRLENGQVLPVLELAYETYGSLIANARQRGAGRPWLHVEPSRRRQNAAGQAGPRRRRGRGRLVRRADRAGQGGRHRPILRGLGECARLGARQHRPQLRSIPRTGKPYGPTFPEITMRDIVASQKLLVDSLGLTSLVAVIGPSMGGFQSFQWAASYPGFMKASRASVTAPRSPGGLERLEALQKRLASDPNWNGGWYYDNGGIAKTLERDPLRHADDLRPERDPGRDHARSESAQGGDPRQRQGVGADLRRPFDGGAAPRDRHRSTSPASTTKLKSTKVLYVQSPRPTSCSTSRSAPAT